MRFVCEVCEASRFAYNADGAMVCVVCNTVSRHYQYSVVDADGGATHFARRSTLSDARASQAKSQREQAERAQAPDALGDAPLQQQLEHVYFALLDVARELCRGDTGALAATWRLLASLLAARYERDAAYTVAWNNATSRGPKRQRSKRMRGIKLRMGASTLVATVFVGVLAGSVARPRSTLEFVRDMAALANDDDDGGGDDDGDSSRQSAAWRLRRRLRPVLHCHPTDFHVTPAVLRKRGAPLVREHGWPALREFWPAAGDVPVRDIAAFARELWRPEGAGAAVGEDTAEERALVTRWNADNELDAAADALLAHALLRRGGRLTIPGAASVVAAGPATMTAAATTVSASSSETAAHGRRRDVYARLLDSAGAVAAHERSQLDEVTAHRRSLPRAERSEPFLDALREALVRREESVSVLHTSPWLATAGIRGAARGAPHGHGAGSDQRASADDDAPAAAAPRVGALQIPRAELRAAVLDRAAKHELLPAV